MRISILIETTQEIVLRLQNMLQKISLLANVHGMQSF